MGSLTLYRVENRDGSGPYQDDWINLPAVDEYSSDQHPVPADDNIFDFEQHWLFGFDNMVQLFDWFGNPQALDNLERFDYHVVMVEGDFDQDTIRRGYRQVVFAPEAIDKRTFLPWISVRQAHKMWVQTVGTANEREDSK